MASPVASVVIVGAGGHSASVAESVLESGRTIDFFVDEYARATSHAGYSVERSLEFVNDMPDASVVVAIGDNHARYECVSRLRASSPSVRFPVIVHPTASIAREASLGAGTVALQGAVVGASARVGDFCILNTGSSLDHESVLADYASLAPGVVTGGRVTVGMRSAIGIGAVVRNNVLIGADTVVGASSYVHRDLPDRVVAFGVPAVVRRTRSVGEPYLK